jgi:hypothetical protein
LLHIPQVLLLKMSATDAPQGVLQFAGTQSGSTAIPLAEQVPDTELMSEISLVVP